MLFSCNPDRIQLESKVRQASHRQAITGTFDAHAKIEYRHAATADMHYQE